MTTSTGMTANSIQTDYMKLLLTQLRNQNPMDPMDNSQMTMQLTQLGQLEQLTNLTTTFGGALAAANRSQATAMIGKTVTFIPAGQSDAVTGRVEGIQLVDGEVKLRVGDELKYTADGKAASSSTRLDDLDQSKNLASTDTITVYGTKPDGTEINSGNGAQIGLHNGWDYLTLGDMANAVTDVLKVDGQETYVAELHDGALTISNKFTGERVEKVHFSYNGSGKFQMPQLSRPLCDLDSVVSITD